MREEGSIHMERRASRALSRKSALRELVHSSFIAPVYNLKLP